VWLAIEEREAGQLNGTIVHTSMDRDGYRVGDPLSAPQDRVLDLVFLGPGGRPLLNEQRARFMVDKRVLVGITVLSKDGDLVEQHQFAGTIASVDPDHGIQLTLDDGGAYWLPPDTRALEEARPGEYRLRSNGQTVVNPDYLCTWTINQPHHPYSMPTDGYRAT
jgi:hypothetical protein